MANHTENTVYLTQRELAERWRCSEGTIINRRKNGIITYFRLPGSDTPLYPFEEILAIEEEYTKQTKPKGGDKKKKAEIKKVEPCVSTPQKEWRI